MRLEGNKIEIVLIALCAIMAITLFPLHSVSASEANSEICLECHDHHEAMLQTEHAIGKMAANDQIINCQVCHSNFNDHIEDPTKDNIDNPESMESLAVDDMCRGCHEGHTEQSDFGYAAHSSMEISCVACHSIHPGESTKTLQRASELCLTCHKQNVSDFAGRTHHPFGEGIVDCIDCHKDFSREYLDQAYNGNISCKKCHLKQTNPHLYEHEAVNNYAVEGDGCVSCHSSHGSENDYLLNQPKDMLCQQCHMPAGHLTAHGGTYANDDCLLCHSEIHGSNNNRYFLDKAMSVTFGGNCYQAGCHQHIE